MPFTRNLFLALLPLALCAQTAPPKPRLFVLTDISNEPDDEESLVRLLVYSNEYDLEGLAATTSIHLRNGTRADIIHGHIDAYAKVQANLALHAAGFPTAAKLHSLVVAGQPGLGMTSVGEGRSTPGSRALVEAALRPDPRPLWVSVWGGANTLAQALWDVKYSRTPEELDAVVAKLRVYTISDQDDAGRWLRITFPGLYYIVSPSVVGGADYSISTWSGISGDRRYKNGEMVDFELVDNPWLTANIIENHGPLGARYPKLAYIMEGDTPAFLNLIGNGLASDVTPAWGGWGGRYALRQSYGETRPIWTNSRDTVKLPDGREHTSNQATVWRWRRAYQHDFAARMDWCVQPKDKANHNPIAVVNGLPGKAPLRLVAKPGESVALSSQGSSDPDGNRVTAAWMAYPEAGTCAAEIAGASAVMPKTAKPCTAHIILTVTDDGTPALSAYRRVIVEVQP
ncbi:MAG: DUF1593 domain-containing protein [Bryobacterales bacterium]|nr:DUF1593 domain-containing protein [Bryobacterales bacterium]